MALLADGIEARGVNVAMGFSLMNAAWGIGHVMGGAGGGALADAAGDVTAFADPRGPVPRGRAHPPADAQPRDPGGARRSPREHVATFAPLRTVTATRYVTPLREGGSLPALVEADDDGLYVLKFRGAGQGPKALVAELVGGEIARALGLPVPEIVLVELDPELARAEPDPEIQDLIRASAGAERRRWTSCPGSLPFGRDAARPPDPAFAADVVWLDAFLTNVDRTPRNPNLLRWHGQTSGSSTTARRSTSSTPG